MVVDHDRIRQQWPYAMEVPDRVAEERRRRRTMVITVLAFCGLLGLSMLYFIFMFVWAAIS